MNTLRILILCLITTVSYAQKKEIKTEQTVKVTKDVVVELNTNYVEIEIDTWNKNEVAVEAYLESDELSQNELKEALKAWDLNLDATTDKVIISSRGNNRPLPFSASSYDGFLEDLEYDLADLPEMPRMPAMPKMPNMSNLTDFPKLPEMPEMPEFPELPELPEGVKTIEFDYEKYQKDGEAYLSEWSKKYEKEGGKELQERMENWARKFAESGYEEKMKKWGEEYGKRFEGQWAKDIEKWGEEYGKRFEGQWAKDMEKWGEEFGERFGKEWEEKMEAWGERFGKQMERQAKSYEKRAELMEKRSEAISKRTKSIAKRSEVIAKRRAELAERNAKKRAKLKSKRDAVWIQKFSDGYDNGVKRVIKIKMPKKAKLKLNVRHGELKVASAVHNATGNLSYTRLAADYINGSDTSINVSYSPVAINKWDSGTLNLSFVEDAHIKSVKNVMLNSKSSNVSIDNLTETGIIDGSFGDLTISNVSESFKNLNLVLENSDAEIFMPQNISYNLFFNGNRSRYNNEPTKQKNVKINGGQSSDNKTIVVNAKFSNVTVN